MSDNHVGIHIHIDEEHRKRLKIRAAEEETSMSEIIRNLISDYLEQDETEWKVSSHTIDMGGMTPEEFKRALASHIKEETDNE